MVGGHHGTDPAVVAFTTPPNGGGGFGSLVPSIVVVAFAAPGVPDVCGAPAALALRSGDGPRHAASASAAMHGAIVGDLMTSKVRNGCESDKPRSTNYVAARVTPARDQNLIVR